MKLKYSRQRECIKEFLMNRKDHPTADVVYSCMRKEFPNISLGTVYRNLSLLTELGEIKKISSENGADRFDAMTHDHYHLTCTECGTVFDIDAKDEDIETLKNIADRINLDIDIDSYKLNFYGKCEKCRKDAKK